jgi:hypothetical protein
VTRCTGGRALSFGCWKRPYTRNNVVDRILGRRAHTQIRVLRQPLNCLQDPSITDLFANDAGPTSNARIGICKLLDQWRFSDGLRFLEGVLRSQANLLDSGQNRLESTAIFDLERAFMALWRIRNRLYQRGHGLNRLPNDYWTKFLPSLPQA